MDTPIPSLAFLTIGKKLISQPIVQSPKSIRVPKTIRAPILTVTDDVSTYDILSEWASLLIDYFGESIYEFM